MLFSYTDCDSISGFLLCRDQDGLLGTKKHTWRLLERARQPAGGSVSFVRFGCNTGIDIVKQETKTTGLNCKCRVAEQVET
jgi:hypothetical protein